MTTFEIPVTLQTDEDGLTGRECPSAECEGYFKVKFGTGLRGSGLPCHCPYCGFVAPHAKFWTKDQIEYARSIAVRKVLSKVQEDLKKMEFEHKPSGAFGLGISLKVTPGTLPPVRTYRESALETHVTCSGCTLDYAVFGLFAFCPDCGEHNSLQILERNLELVEKFLSLSTTESGDAREGLLKAALSECVAAFDGFGRELCNRRAGAAGGAPAKGGIRFQNLEGAAKNVEQLFGLDIRTLLEPDNWAELRRLFAKRHVIAHRMGVVDDEYVSKTGDPTVLVGRKLPLTEHEVRRLVALVREFARQLAKGLGPAAQEAPMSEAESGETG